MKEPVYEDAIRTWMAGAAAPRAELSTHERTIRSDENTTCVRDTPNLKRPNEASKLIRGGPTQAGLTKGRLPKNHIPMRVAKGLALLSSAATSIALLAGAAAQGQSASPIVLSTISSLRALNPSTFTNDTVALVVDYYTPSQYFDTANGYSGRGRGGGLFRWLTPTNYAIATPPAADDGGRWIAPNSPYSANGLWERLLQGETPNVKMWGAKGDGVNNDYASVQNAVNACLSVRA
jgi:hypothetical protein